MDFFLLHLCPVFIFVWNLHDYLFPIYNLPLLNWIANLIFSIQVFGCWRPSSYHFCWRTRNWCRIFVASRKLFTVRPSTFFNRCVLHYQLFWSFQSISPFSPIFADVSPRALEFRDAGGRDSFFINYCRLDVFKGCILVNVNGGCVLLLWAFNWRFIFNLCSDLVFSQNRYNGPEIHSFVMLQTRTGLIMWCRRKGLDRNCMV